MQNPMAGRGLFVLIVALLSGCGKSFNDSTVQMWVEPEIIRPELAYELSRDEELKVRFDHYLIENLEIQGGDRFASFFGGRDSRAVARWLADGVKYVAPGSRSEDKLIGTNFGAGLYISGIIEGQFKSVEWTSGRWMTPSSAKNGLIVVHRYAREGNTVRAGFWTHERRHGDCDHPPAKEDLASMTRRQKADKWYSGPADIRSCGHQHIICPKGHDLEGLGACDDEKDGSYAYGLEWTRTVRDTCKNCDDSIKDVSTGLLIEYASRIVAP